MSIEFRAFKHTPFNGDDAPLARADIADLKGFATFTLTSQICSSSMAMGMAVSLNYQAAARII